MRILALLACLCVALCFESLVGISGLQYIDPEATYGDYTLFCPNLDNHAYLIDMHGDVVHTWTLKHRPGVHVQMMENGNLLCTQAPPDPNMERTCAIGGAGGYVIEYDWDSNEVWRYEMYTKTEVQHHTFYRRDNGNTFILGWEEIPNERFIEMGRDPASIPEYAVRKGIKHYNFWIDFVREVNPAGETVWEFHMADHIGTGPMQLDPNFHIPAKNQHDLYASFDYTHCNTVQWDEESQTVMMVSRNIGEVYHIDYNTKQIVWRWGNPAVWNSDARAPSWYDDGDRQLWGPHHATFIKGGLVQVFDNGVERPRGNRSRVVVVDPKTDEVVWQYHSWDNSSFFSAYQGAAQRLPNDNVLVTSTNLGHVFEVTPEGRVVWDWVSPVTTDGALMCGMADSDKATHGMSPNFMSNAIHRAYRYPASHAGFQGRTLTPKPFLPGCPVPHDMLAAYEASLEREVVIDL